VRLVPGVMFTAGVQVPTLEGIVQRFCGRPVALLVLVSVAVHLFVPAALAASEMVKIPGGTVLVLAFENALHPESAQVGEKVYLRVVTAVTVDGRTVIEGGARATAEVTHSQMKGAIGKPAVIGVMARAVEAVDGTMIPISGVKHVEGENKQSEALIITILCCILGLIIQGGEAELAAGTNMEVTIDATTSVEVSAE